MMFACVVFLAAVVSLHAAPEHTGEANLAKGQTSNNSTEYNSNYDVMYEGNNGIMENSDYRILTAASLGLNGTETKAHFFIQEKLKSLIKDLNKVITKLPIETRDNVTNKLRDILLKYKRAEMTKFDAENDNLEQKEISEINKNADLLNNTDTTTNENRTEPLQPSSQGESDVNSFSDIITILSSNNLDEKSKQFLKDLLASSYNISANAGDATTLPPVHPSLFEFVIHGVRRQRIDNDKDDKEEEEDESEEKTAQSDSLNLSFPVEPLTNIFFEDESPKKLSTGQNTLPVSPMMSSVTRSSVSPKQINVNENNQQNTKPFDVIAQLPDILPHQEEVLLRMDKEHNPHHNSDTLFEHVPLSKLLSEPISNTNLWEVRSVRDKQPDRHISSTDIWGETRPNVAAHNEKQHEFDNVFLAGSSQTAGTLDLLSQLTNIFGDPQNNAEINKNADEDSHELHDDPFQEKSHNSNFQVNPTANTIRLEHKDTIHSKQPKTNLPELHTKAMGGPSELKPLNTFLASSLEKSPSELKLLNTFLASSLERTQSLDAASHFKKVPDPLQEINALENLLRLAEGFSPGDENQNSVSFKDQNVSTGDNLLMKILQDEDANKNTIDTGESESKEDDETERVVAPNVNTHNVLMGSTGSGNDENLSHISSVDLISALFPTERQRQVNVIRFTGIDDGQKEKIGKGDIIDSQESEEDTYDELSSTEDKKHPSGGVVALESENEKPSSTEVQKSDGKGNSQVNLSGVNTESASTESNGLEDFSLDRKSYIAALFDVSSQSSEKISGKDSSNSEAHTDLQSSRADDLDSIEQDSYELGITGQDSSISVEQKSSNSISSEKQPNNSTSTEQSSSKSGSNEQDSHNSGSSEQDSNHLNRNEQDSSNSGSSEQNSQDSNSNESNSSSGRSEQYSSNSSSDVNSSNSDSSEDSSYSDSSEKNSSNSASSEEDSSNSDSSEGDSSSSNSSEDSSNSGSSEDYSSSSNSSEEDSSSSNSSKENSSSSDSSEGDSSDSASSENDSSHSDSSLEDSRNESSDSSDDSSKVSESGSVSESSSEEEGLLPIDTIPRVQKPADLPQQPNTRPELPVDHTLPPLIGPQNDEKYVPILPDQKGRVDEIPQDEEIILRNPNNNRNFEDGWDNALNIFKPIENDDDLFFAIQNIDISLPKELEEKNHYEEKKTGYGYNRIRDLLSKYDKLRKTYQKGYSKLSDYKAERSYDNKAKDYIQPSKYSGYSTYPDDSNRYGRVRTYSNDVGYIQPTKYTRYSTSYQDHSNSYGRDRTYNYEDYIQPNKYIRHPIYSDNIHSKNPRKRYGDSSKLLMHDDSKYEKFTVNGQKVFKLSSNELKELNQLYRASEHPNRPGSFDTHVNSNPYPVFRGRQRILNDPMPDYIFRGLTSQNFRTYGGRRLNHRDLINRMLHNRRLSEHRGWISSPERPFTRRRILGEHVSLHPHGNRDFIYPNIHRHRLR
uniref:Uncharacterized protein LOC111128073 n=1 Tax=Crassostrea virginica TaxID=6565 RepID=A0A8B8DN61_CRAVI|nr:uncharacterized protein LOC111128073 [Crassostrea virginica]